MQQDETSLFSIRDSGNNGGDSMETHIGRLESDVEYIKRDIQDIKSDMKDMRIELKGEISDLRTEMRLELNDVRNEMRTGFSRIDSRIDNINEEIKNQRSWFIAIFIALILGFVGIIVSGAEPV